MEGLAVPASHIDRVAHDEVFQETEVRIAMRGVDGDTAFAGVGRELDVARTERQRLAAASGKNDSLCMQPLDLDARDRPGVRPRPRLDVVARDDGLRERLSQQD